MNYFHSEISVLNAGVIRPEHRLKPQCFSERIFHAGTVGKCEQVSFEEKRETSDFAGIMWSLGVVQLNCSGNQTVHPFEKTTFMNGEERTLLLMKSN